MSKRLRVIAALVCFVIALPLLVTQEKASVTYVGEERRPSPARVEQRPPARAEVSAHPSDALLQSAYNNRQSNLQVQGQGEVSRILTDDNQGSRHQRFILRLSTGQTLLVAHNIDLAPCINSLSVGDVVEFYGEYEWNQEGGVIHWTHHDPAGRHVGGWLRHRGQVYQ